MGNTRQLYDPHFLAELGLDYELVPIDMKRGV